jgi:hypothetical protein
LFAWDDGEPKTWSDTDFLKDYEKQGEKLVPEAEARATVDLPLAIRPESDGLRQDHGASVMLAGLPSVFPLAVMFTSLRPLVVKWAFVELSRRAQSFQCGFTYWRHPAGVAVVIVDTRRDVFCRTAWERCAMKHDRGRRKGIISR